MTKPIAKVVVVTGSGSGIGRAVARAFADQGDHVALVDVDAARLEAVSHEVAMSGGKCHVFKADVSDEDSVRRMVKDVEDQLGPIDILVNNAGVGLACEIRELDLGRWRRVLEVNYFGTVHGIQAVLPGMLERGRGHIVNVASANGLFPFPLEGAYASSKAAVVALSEVMHMELRSRGIDVTLLCPGLVRTRILEDAHFGALAPKRELLSTIMARRGVEPEVIARALLRGVRRKQFLVRTPFYVSLAHGFFKLFPGLYRALAAWAISHMR